MSTPEATPAVNRKLLIALGAVTALALMAALVILPVLSDDPPEQVDPAATGQALDAEPGPDSSPPDEPADQEDAADEVDEADRDDQVDETFEVFTARDPFRQLVVPTAVEEPVATGPVGDGEQEPSTDEPLPPAQEQVEVHVVEIVDVYRDGAVDKVQVSVNGTGYDVAVNERFADHFQVLSIDGECGTFLHEDSRFVLCTGDTVRK